jgi:hypothetical protein
MCGALGQRECLADVPILQHMVARIQALFREMLQFDPRHDPLQC